MDTGLTLIPESDIEKHRATAQGLITRLVVLEDPSARATTALAGTNRRFVSPVATGGVRRTREVELSRTVGAVRPEDPLMGIGQHALLFRARRGLAVALAVSDSFARSSDLEALQAQNSRTPLEGEPAVQFRRLLSASAYVAGFAFLSYLLRMTEAGTEEGSDPPEPEYLFDTPLDALKSLVAGLDAALKGASDEAALASRTKNFAQTAIAGLLQRKNRFDGLGAFENAHLRVEADDFTLDGFDVAPSAKSKPLVMTFKKPEEVVGNHIAKYQAVKLAKMMMAYDFDRQLNPFVELGGFLFTFIGDGSPGTGKTTLIQMIAGLLNDYCTMAGFPFHYENFGVDQISSYQGKSGQNCRQFVENVLNPRAIGFGTVDDIDQVAAKRSDDRASAGQQEITGVLMEAMLMPYRGAGRLIVLQPYLPVAADVDGDTVRSVTVRHRDTGLKITISADYVLDATELGDLLPMTGTEYVKGFEAQSDTGEPSAPAEAQPDNVQAVSVCFAVDCVDGDQTIDKPENYDYWRKYQPHFWGGPLLGFTAPHPRTLEFTTRSFTPNVGDNPLLVDADQRKGGGDENLWLFRRIAARDNFQPGFYASDICFVNWPMIDYMDGTIIDVSEEEKARHLKSAADLSYSVFYWLQTEAPRVDGGQGYRGLRLRGDITGTEHGLAMAPYIRESRRIQPVTRIVEQDMSEAVRGTKGAVNYRDSIGIGMYRIDLHPSTGGDNYIDVPSCPFEIPLGSLLPKRMKNLIAAGKNIGTTHITNGCYRLHPVEWNVGEAAGMLAAYCLEKDLKPHQVQADDKHLADFQRELTREGVEIRWPHIAAY